MKDKTKTKMGRPRKMRPCPTCGKMFSGRAILAHDCPKKVA